MYGVGTGTSGNEVVLSCRWYICVYVVFQFVSCVLLLVLSCLVCNCCWLTVCIVVVVLCVLLCFVYLLYCVGIAFFLLQLLDCWLEISIRKVLRPATSTQVFLGFPVPISKCGDGSQDSKLPLHASHVALPT